MIVYSEEYYSDTDLVFRKVWGGSHPSGHAGFVIETFSASEDNCLISREFWIDGKCGRNPLEGPAYTTFRPDGSIIASYWWENGSMIHNIQYPATGERPWTAHWMNT